MHYILLWISIEVTIISWLRTTTNRIPSEATTADYLRKFAYRMYHCHMDLSIMQQFSGIQFATWFSPFRISTDQLYFQLPSEDNMSVKINDDRFTKLNATYVGRKYMQKEKEP